MELHGKVQKWIDHIIADSLENVATESKEIKEWSTDTKLNKLLFKALLCLSHTADRSKPSAIKTGKQIYEITRRVCYSMTEIPDFIKYYSSLYHIIRKLIAMQLYSEAMRVTALSFPSDILCGLTPQHIDMYPKIAGLWHQAAIDLIDSSPKGLKKTDQKLILEFLNNELRVYEVVVKERSTLVLTKIFRYLTKLDTLDDRRSYRDSVNNFFGRIDVSLVGAEKYDVYQDALRFINLGASAMVGKLSIEDAREVFLNGCEIVEKVMSQDEELNSCFLIYKNIGIMLFKPVDKSNEISHWSYKDIERDTLNIIYNFKSGDGILLNMKMIGYIIQSLSERWENCISNSDDKFLNSELLKDLLNLIKLMFQVLNSISVENCENCRGNVCKMRKSTFSVTVVSIRCLVILSKITDADLLKHILKPMQELLEENVAAIFEMKESNCAHWTALWNNCGINIYNLSVTCYKKFYEETVFLFSLLCSCIVKFEGINAVNSLLAINNPLSYSLHKLSGVHFNHGNYREALTPCALNGLLSYQNSDTKAFRMWTSIKNASTNLQSILKITMLSCLTEDMDVISEIGVNLNLRDYDLKELCLQELRALQESRFNMSVAMCAVLDELEILDSKSLEYAQGVQLLGYHLLHYEYDDNFTRYFKRAVRNLNDNKSQNDSHFLIAASLCFYTFVIDLRQISERTKSEMEKAKFALRAVKSNVPEGQPKSNDNVVPAYTEINVTKDSKLFSHLKLAIDKWSRCLEKNLLGIVSEWHLVLTLRTLVTVGEYSRLHRFSTLETKAWELSFKLASQLKDSRTCVYVIGRSMSLRKVNSEWINTGNNLIAELKSSADPEANNSVASFWLGLSNFYFRIGKHEEATKIVQKVLSLPNVSPLKNVSSYLLSMDTILRNYYLFSNDNRSTKYMVYVVKCLYSMLSLIEYGPSARVGKEKQLNSLEVLFTSTSHLAVIMNSLLSFKEITSHLVNRLKLSQSSGITLRVAESLKNLCFIDLSRMQLDDCVVKLQGLEYILQTEYIGESRNSKNSGTCNNEFNKPGARDTQVKDASPVLKKTVFKLPDFITHTKCSCYKCSSVDYQYLVLSGTHIRAQLYFLQGHLNEALEHFGGLFFLRRKMLMLEMHRNATSMKFSQENNTDRKQPLYHTAEYVLLLINFSRLIRELGNDYRQDGIKVATEAVKVCEKFNIVGHTVYISAKELVLEYQFCRTIKDSDFNKFTVPDASSIDINKFTHKVSSVESSAIATPACKPPVIKPKTIHRNKTPPLFKLTKVSMDLSDDDGDDTEGSTTESPKTSRHRTKSSRNHRVAIKSMKRKNLEKYLDLGPDCSSADNESESEDDDESHVKMSSQSLNKEKDFLKMINKATLVFPNLSEKFMEIVDEKGTRESVKIKRVVKLIECAEPKSKPRTVHERRNKNKNFQKKDCDDVVSEIINAFKEMIDVDEDLSEIIDWKVNLSENSDEASSSMNSSTSNFDTKEFDVRRVDKTTKKKLSEYYNNVSVNELKDVSVIPKPQYNQNKEKLRTSDRIKRSRSKSIEKKRNEKPKTLLKTRSKSLRVESENENRTGDIEDKKLKPQNLRRIKKLESQSPIYGIDNFQLDDSGLVPTSDLEEKAIFEEKMKGVGSKYKSKISSRILRSRSEMNGTSSRLKATENIDIVSLSEPEDESETVKRKNNEPKRKQKASSRLKNIDNQSSESVENQGDPETPVLIVSKDLEAKKPGNKRTNSSLSKVKR